MTELNVTSPMPAERNAPTLEGIGALEGALKSFLSSTILSILTTPIIRLLTVLTVADLGGEDVLKELRRIFHLAEHSAQLSGD